MGLTNEALSLLVLPWAKEHRPEAYAKTLKVARNPTVFRRYLLRLVEVRCEADRQWRNTEVPVSVLDETSLEIRVRTKAEPAEEMVFKGRAAKPPHDHRIFELALDKASFTDLQNLKRTLDMEYVIDEPKKE